VLDAKKWSIVDIFFWSVWEILEGRIFQLYKPVTVDAFKMS
jgi:hypothetical protein